MVVSLSRADRSIGAFTALGHATFHGLELSVPLLVPVWLDTFDVSPTIMGLVVGAGFAFVGIAAPLAGRLADAYGSKRLVMVSIGGMGLAFVGVSSVPSVEALALALILWGTVGSLYHPAALSLISRGAERRGTVLAVHGAGGNLGMVLFPLVTIFLLGAFDWRTATRFLSVPAMICLGYGFVVTLDEKSRQDESASTRLDGDGPTTDRVLISVRQFLGSTRALFLGGFAFVFAIQMGFGVYYRGIFTFLPDVLANIPVFESITVADREIDASQFAYIGLLLVGVAGQYAGGAFSDRFDTEVTLVGTFLAISVLTLLFLPASGGALPLLAVCAGLGFVVFVFVPVGQVLVAEYVPDASHGLAFGYVYLGTFGVGALGSALAGAVLDYGTFADLFVTLAGIATVCAGIAVVQIVRLR